MPIDLLLVGVGDAAPEWTLGAVHRAEATPGAVAAAVGRAQRSATPPDAVLHWGLATPPPAAALLQRLLDQPDDAWHAGLALGTGGLPHAIDAVAPTWMLNCDPDPAIEATSWRLSLRACLVRMRVVDALGHVDPRYTSLDTAALDLGHRWINHGARVRHVAALAAGGTAPAPAIDLADELRFIDLRYGRKWMGWAAAAESRRPLAAARAVRAAARRGPPPPAAPSTDLEAATSGTPDAGSVTVLIPTVERYPFLEVILGQLRTQTVAPAQVIVIDQTPAADRRPELFAAFDDLPLELVTLAEPGQCSARNAGLERATADHVLFIDDDDEIPADLIERHLASLGERRVDVSSGVVQEPTGPARSAEFSRFRVSDTFPTNNTMARRDALAASGWFDLAYDRGDRADHDVGMRLYLSGARMIMDPRIEVVHHHAPSGGLRVHRARAITYGGSRGTITVRQPLSPTNIYLWRRYFSTEQVRKGVRLHLFSGLFGTGPAWRRAARLAVQAASLPIARRELREAQAKADAIFAVNPRIQTPDRTTREP